MKLYAKNLKFYYFLINLVYNYVFLGHTAWSGIPFSSMGEDIFSSYFDFQDSNDNCVDDGDGGFDNDGGLLGQMQSIYELDGNYNVILQGRIGVGFYGEVYQGTLESVSAKDDIEPRQVAIKKLKMQAIEDNLRDFEREIDIMKVLFQF